MAAAYAALVSLTHIIKQTMENHARHPIFSPKQQRQIESLRQKVSFLQDFLELVYSNGCIYEAEGLESRIADAANAAEDIIESHVVDTIVFQPTKKQTEKKRTEKIKFTSHGKNRSNHFSQGLQKIIENIDSIRKVVMEIKENIRVEDQQPCDQVPFLSSRPPPTGKDTVVEYYDDDLEQIMDELVGQSSNLQIIPIVGMGGIGKTTLARYVYDKPLIVECFYIRAWVTISQEYNLRKMLLSLLHEIGAHVNEREQESSEYHQLGEKLYKHLSHRNYLIILDDIWSIDVWEKLKLFLPNNNNRSRVMITTRLSNVANMFDSSLLYKMNLLNENKSWSLLCRKVFSHNGKCPPELVKIGKDIAKNCHGLPLSIVVIGGLLAKYEMTRKNWEYVAKDINKIIYSKDNGHWLKILLLSYNHLPIYLKPCFLYMGVYPKDREIRISKLIKLWVVEGFLKPIKAKSLDEVAKDYLKPKAWTCSIHDLLKDLCLLEAHKERFLCVFRSDNLGQIVSDERRIVFHKGWSHERDSRQFHRALLSTPFVRSFSCDFDTWSSSRESVDNLRLLRVFTVANTLSGLESILQLVNLRYFKCDLHWGVSAVPSPMCRLWYLQTLVLTGYATVIAPIEIWGMTQLRHIIVKSGICLPDLLPGQMDMQEDSILKNLQTLSCIRNLKCTEEVLKRIPNIMKLSIDLQSEVDKGTSNYYCFHNLGRLHKLQSLTCTFLGDTASFFHNVVFPQSLKKLTLWGCRLDWDDITTKVGLLPHLEKLKMYSCVAGAEWNTVEGKFPSLKFLEICRCYDLVYWTSDTTHFPFLERLVLKSVMRLKEIPSCIGDTLQSIELVFCTSSIVDSAREILEEQKSMGNEGIRLTVRA